MFRRLYNLLTWVWSPSRNPTILEIDDEWIALMSSVEVRTVTRDQKSIESELVRLRKSNSSTRLSTITKEVRRLFPQEGLGSLMSDLRYKIFKELFIRVSPQWLEVLGEDCADIVDYWWPTTYQKNVLGQMIDVCHQTSSDELTVTNLSEMIRRTHLCLINILANDYHTTVQGDCLLQMMIQTIT